MVDARRREQRADGLTLVSMGSETIDKTTTMTVCTAMSSGTYTRALPM